MASQKFALQRKLAELPQFPVTAETADHLSDAIDAINRGYTGDVAETTLGPVIETSRGPVKMQLIMAEEGMSPLRASQISAYDNLGIGQMGRYGLVDAVGGARNLVDVSFNMIDPDGRPVFGYDPITELAAKKQIQAAGGYRKPMMEALYKLIEQTGMQPGDLLKATPIGMDRGDMRRALTYMAQGFGAPDTESGQMYARVARGGGLEPAQLFSPNQSIAKRIGAQLDLRRMFPPKQLELDLTPERTISNLDELYTPGSARPSQILDPNVPF